MAGALPCFPGHRVRGGQGPATLPLLSGPSLGPSSPVVGSGSLSAAFLLSDHFFIREPHLTGGGYATRAWSPAVDAVCFSRCRSLAPHQQVDANKFSDEGVSRLLRFDVAHPAPLVSRHRNCLARGKALGKQELLFCLPICRDIIKKS